jgi:hypothetical protein
MGNHMNKAMQAAWNAHGEAGFAYEVLEQFPDEDLEPYVLTSRLKEREAHWLAALNARRAVG